MPAQNPRRVILPEDAANAAVRGRSTLSDASGLSDDTGAGDEPGEAAVHLHAPSGTFLGTAVRDCDNNAWRIFAREPLEQITPELLAARVARAVGLRRRLGLTDETEAWRAVNAEGDALPGIAADILGTCAVVYAYGRGLIPIAREVAQALLEKTAATGAVVKLRRGGAVRPGPVHQETVGETPPEALVVREHGIPFEVHPLAGLGTGLFTDLRPHRQDAGRWCRGRRVLNLFAYTGGLSVIAARAQAASVTSVDLSAGVLDWARANFRLSSLDPDDARFRFEPADVPRFTRQAAARGEEYDTVLIDPPAVSAASPANWSQKRDYPTLIAHAAELLPRTGGTLWLTDHASRGRALGRVIQEGLTRCGRAARVLAVGGLPPDHPTSPAHPETRCLQVAVVELGEVDR